MTTFSLPRTDIPVGDEFLSTFQYLAQQLPLLFPAIIALITITIAIAGHKMQKKEDYDASLSLWFLIAITIMLSASTILSLMGGVISKIFLTSMLVAWVVAITTYLLNRD